MIWGDERMEVEEAIQTAIELEKKVREVYSRALDRARAPRARKFLAVMADEEQEHVDYLEAKLAEWTRTGAVDPEGLGTALPPREVIEEKAAQLSTSMEGVADAEEMDLFSKALAVETETSAFYREMTAALPEAGRRLFERFAEIEEGHVAIVQAEINHAANFGVWFDVQEFVL
jgi:rubrerythrin